MADIHDGDPEGASKPIEERLRLMIDQVPALVWRDGFHAGLRLNQAEGRLWCWLIRLY